MALAKPSVTAWAVNALYHHERERFDRLIVTSAQVRAALAGEGDRKKADASRRKALQELLRRAATLLTRAGHAATPVSRQRVNHTLETLAARDPAEAEPRAGRLTSDLEPQGFDVLAGLAASLASPSPKTPTATPAARKPGDGKPHAAPRNKTPDPKIEAARRKVAERQAAHDELERKVETAEAEAAESVERQEQRMEEAAEAKRLAGEAARAATKAKRRTAATRAALTEVRAARRKAVSRLATAKRALDRYES